MSTQISMLGFSSYTVDAISWTPIYLRYARRDAGEARLENESAVTVNLRTDSADSTKERALLSGDPIEVKIGGPRATGFAPEIPVCFAKAASGTAVLRLIER